jgi:hypothetical protein
MTGFTADVCNLLLLFTTHYITHYVFSSPPPSTAASGDSLNSNSSCVRSSLYSRGADPQKTPSLTLLPLSDVVSETYLPSNVPLLWLHYSAFQASFHYTYIYIFFNCFLCDFSYLADYEAYFLLLQICFTTCTDPLRSQLNWLENSSRPI